MVTIAEIDGDNSTVAVSEVAIDPIVDFDIDVDPSDITAGGYVTVAVTALDHLGDIADWYNGYVYVTTSDPRGIIEGHATLINGTGSFQVWLLTAGNHTITVTNPHNWSISAGGYAAVHPGPATHYMLAGPPVVDTGDLDFTVTALDAYRNTATGYAGTVHFTSSDEAATLPANSTLTNGAGTFNATLNAGGTPRITATDTVTDTITGSLIVHRNGQWASEVWDYSTSYSEVDSELGHPEFALDGPDIAANADSYTRLLNGWAPNGDDNPPEPDQFLTVGFDTPVHATGVRLRMVSSGDNYTRIELLEPDETAHTVWSDFDQTSTTQAEDLFVSFPALRISCRQ